jgi:hypothetical protein
MAFDHQQEQLQKPQVKGDDIESPSTDIGTDTEPEDQLTVVVRPIEYRTVKRNLKYFSMQLKNATVAYMGNETIKIERCVGYFYNKDKSHDDALKKAIADALSNDQSCAILLDAQQNTYVALLSSDLYYRNIHTPDDSSSSYAGLTYLETRGKHYASILWSKLLVTTDKHILAPIAYPNEYIHNNAYFTRINENIAYESDYIIFLISLIKSGKLEFYIKGHARFSQ